MKNEKTLTCGKCAGTGLVNDLPMCQCGHRVPANAAYCPTCGMQIPIRNRSDVRKPCPVCGGAGRESTSKD